MSYSSALSRVSEIQGSVAPTAPSRSAPAQSGALNAQEFAAFMRRATINQPSQTSASTAALMAPTALSPTAAPGRIDFSGRSTGQKIVTLAQAELNKGVKELQTNDSPDIARYRTATKGAVGGAPWCAYFVSYIAARAGVPIGSSGQGYGLVADVARWGQSTNRWHQQPQPGDLIVFNGHIGIVEKVEKNRLTTIEGNSSNAVTQRTRTLDQALGYIQL